MIGRVILDGLVLFFKRGTPWQMPLVVRYFSNCSTCFGLPTIFISLDIIKLSILSRDVYNCHELALFLRNHLAHSQKPLLAVGMGQFSRVLSPISLVTHRLLPAPSTPGQLTLAEVHQARHLIGQLPKREFSIVGDPVSGASVCRMHEAPLGTSAFRTASASWRATSRRSKH